MPSVAFSCFQCGHSVQLITAQKVLKNDTCPKCKADLHTCRNCRFFDPSVHNECRENQAEWVRYKDRANYCDYFEPSTHVDLVRKSGASAEDAKKKWDSLFKK
jgi:hypothetical protein